MNRDPEGRFLEDAATRRLARDANRSRRPCRRDRASRARTGERPDRLRWRHLRPGAVTALACRRVPPHYPAGCARRRAPLFKDLAAPLHLELVEATTYGTGLAIHVYRPRSRSADQPAILRNQTTLCRRLCKPTRGDSISPRLLNGGLQ